MQPSAVQGIFHRVLECLTGTCNTQDIPDLCSHIRFIPIKNRTRRSFRCIRVRSHDQKTGRKLLFLDNGLVPAIQRLNTKKLGDGGCKIGKAVIVAVNNFVRVFVRCVVVENAGDLV